MMEIPASGASRGRVLSRDNLAQMARAANLSTDDGRNHPDDGLSPAHFSQEILEVLNNDPASLGVHEPRWIESLDMQPDAQLLYPTMQTVLPSLVGTQGNYTPHFALPIEPIDPYGYGRAVMRGGVLCKIFEPTDLAWCKYVGYIPGTTLQYLTVDPSGSAEIIWKDPTGANVAKWAMVHLGPPVQRTQLGVTAADIQPDTSGLVNCWDSGIDQVFQITAELDWMHGDEQVSSGKQVICLFFPQENKWRIVGAECEAGAAGATPIASTKVIFDTPQTLTNTFAAPTGMVQDFQSGSATVTGTGSNFVAVTEPGTYRVDLNFAAEVQANNTDMSYQTVGTNATQQGPVLTGRSASDVISGGANSYYEVSQSDLDGSPTPGSVSLGVEYNSGGSGSSSIIWKLNKLSVQKV